MRRRPLLIGGVAALGLAAGGGTAWWRGRGREPAASPAVDVWSMSFASPDGAALAMQSLHGRPLLLNFWATWCAPCVTEMPLLDAFARDPGNAPWQVLALAVDQPAPVHRFVAEHRLTLRIALAGADGLDLSRALGNDLGALPFSVAFDGRGQPAERKIGSLTSDLLTAWKRSIR